MIIYLDQAKWIDVLKAQSGRADGARYKDALRSLQRAVSDHKIIVPLSSAHYMETIRNPSYEKRLALANLMINISRRNTIAPSTETIPHEVEVAVVKTFNIDAKVPPFQIIGKGIAHAFMIDDAIERVKRIEKLMFERAACLKWSRVACFSALLTTHQLPVSKRPHRSFQGRPSLHK